MVGTDSIADLRAFLVLLSKFGTKDSMRIFRFILTNLTDIMKQTCPTCNFRIKTELGCHGSTNISHLP